MMNSRRLADLQICAWEASRERPALTVRQRWMALTHRMRKLTQQMRLVQTAFRKLWEACDKWFQALRRVLRTGLPPVDDLEDIEELYRDFRMQRGVAQWLERRPPKPRGGSSNLSAPANAP